MGRAKSGRAPPRRRGGCTGWVQFEAKFFLERFENQLKVFTLKPVENRERFQHAGGVKLMCCSTCTDLYHEELYGVQCGVEDAQRGEGVLLGLEERLQH